MSIAKKSVVIASTDVTKTLSFNGSYGRILKIKLDSSADESLGLTIVDADSETIWASTNNAQDYKPAVTKYLVRSTAVDQTDTAAVSGSNAAIPIAHSPLTLTPTGLGSGTLTVTVWVESTVVA